MSGPRLAIVTDSTSDLPEDLCEELGITVVPLMVTIEGESMPDRTLSSEEFFRRMRAMSDLPTTSQPAVGTFVETYKRILEEVPEILSMHISSKLSGTPSSARRAAEEFPGKVHVFDSKNLSWGLGFQVLEAARKVAEGLDLQNVMAHVEDVRNRARLILGVDTLENLVKGGRLNRFSGAIGGRLNIKVILVVRDGELVLQKKVRGSKAAMDYGMRWIEEQLGDDKRGAFCAMHALAEDTAEWFRSKIEKRFEPTELHVAETGSVIATHTGTGWGVAFVPER